MFLREQPFKKLLKRAYKGGLVIGNTGERIYLSGGGVGDGYQAEIPSQDHFSTDH